MKRLAAALLGATLAAAAAPAGATEADVELYEGALEFLLEQQHDNGGWGQIPNGPPGEVGITSLALRGLADSPLRGREDVQEAAEDAIAYILEHQAEDGSFTHERSGLGTYRTAIAVMALTSWDAERFAPQVEKAVAWLRNDQFDAEEDVPRDDPHFGGYGYGKAGENPDADLSNTHLALAALKEAGVSEDDPVFQRAMTFLRRCQNSSETNPGVGGLQPLDDGGFIYDPGLSRNKSGMIEHEDGTRSFISYSSMTYAGLMSLIHAGLTPDDQEVQAALGWIATNYTLDSNKGLGVRADDPNADQQGLYYYYHSFAKCLSVLGEDTVETEDGPRRWARDLFDALHARVKEGGSFRNENSRWWEQDPVLCTTYVLNAMNYAIPFLGEGEFPTGSGDGE